MGVSPLRVPLDADDKVGRRVKLDCLDHSVARRNSTYQQIVARDLDGLVVAGIDLRLRIFAWHEEGSQP